MTTYPTGVDAALLNGVDGVLGARDAVGAIIQPVYFVTRTWFSDSGLTTPNTAPEGFFSDVTSQVLPSPGMKTFAQDVRVREGGAVKAGDILLKGISKHKYQESDVDGSTPSANVQKFFKIGVKLYQVISVRQRHVTFDVMVRELSNQAGY